MTPHELVALKKFGGSIVVGLPPSILAAIDLREGDRVVMECLPPRRLLLTKEGPQLRPTDFLELEIDLLEKKKILINSDLEYKTYQFNKNMPEDEGMHDASIAQAILYSLVRERNRIDVEIAEKRLALYEIQAGPVGTPAKSESAPRAEDQAELVLDNKPSVNAAGKSNLSQLLDEFESTVKRKADKRFAQLLRKEILASNPPQLTGSTRYRLSKWCHTGGAYRGGMVVARRISEELFGRVIDRG